MLIGIVQRAVAATKRYASDQSIIHRTQTSNVRMQVRRLNIINPPPTLCGDGGGDCKHHDRLKSRGVALLDRVACACNRLKQFKWAPAKADSSLFYRYRGMGSNTPMLRKKQCVLWETLFIYFERATSDVHSRISCKIIIKHGNIQSASSSIACLRFATRSW